jgi:hypothetical protein
MQQASRLSALLNTIPSQQRLIIATLVITTAMPAVLTLQETLRQRTR